MESSPQSALPYRQGFSGTVSEVTKDEVVLINATEEKGHLRIVPILGDAPLIGAFFRYVAMEREKAGTVRIPVAKVAAIEVDDR